MIVMRENDALFSRQYESYSLVGLARDNFSVQDRFAKWNEVFQEMKLVSTQCENSLTEANIGC